MNILFANISYCHNDEQNGYFRYVNDTGNALEKYNFEPTIWNGEKVCLGYFEPGFTKGGYEKGKRREVHIKKIDNNPLKEPYIDNVLVIWCSTINDISHSSIVGWYNNAKVYRIPKKLPLNAVPNRGIPQWGYLFNTKTLVHNCVSLSYSEIISDKWIAPRKNKCGFGFGQSNMWYAREESAQDYVNYIISQIKSYK